MVFVLEVLMVDLLFLNIYVMLDVVGYPRLNMLWLMVLGKPLII